MSASTDALKRAGRALLLAFFASPALWPIENGITVTAELVGIPLSDWFLLAFLLAIGVALAAVYDGPAGVVLATALLTVILFVGFQWIVGLRGLNVISLRLLAANAFVYLAAVSCAITIVFESPLSQRILGFYGADAGDSSTA